LDPILRQAAQVSAAQVSAAQVSAAQASRAFIVLLQLLDPMPLNLDI
jgi:hypothetical protein